METDGNEGDDEMESENVTSSYNTSCATENITTCAKRARMESTTNSTVAIISDTSAVMKMSPTRTPEELLTVDQMNITIDADVETYLRMHKMHVIPASPDGHCLIHSWSIYTGMPIHEIKDIIRTEFYDHSDDYTPFGITQEQLNSYLNDNQYNLNSSDTVINILANATNSTAIVIGQRCTIINDPQCDNGVRYEMIPDTTEFQQIKSKRPNHDEPGKFVLLLKSAAHFDAIIIKE